MERENEIMVIGGIFDGLLNGLLENFKPNLRNIDHAMMQDGVSKIIDSVKPAIPGKLDDMVLDAAKVALVNIIEGWKHTGPLVVGATADQEEVMVFGEVGVATSKRLRSRKDVEDAIVAEGGDPKKFAPWLLLALQFLPDIIAIIQKLLGK